MAPALHFENAFWSQKRPEDPLPDFQTGLQVLHSKLNQSKVENDEIIGFFKERIAIEESYAARLSDQSKGTSKSSGFGNDEGAVLKGCFENMRDASGRFGQQHKQTAAALSDSVLKPLSKFQDEYKRSITTSKQSVDAALKQFDGLVKEMDRAKATYQKRWREAEAASEQLQSQKKEQAEKSPPTPPPKEETEKESLREEGHEEESPKDESSKEEAGTEESVKKEKAGEEKPKEQDNETILIGNQRMTRSELNAFVAKFRSEVKVGDYRVPIIGRYQNTSTGEDISVWLQKNMPQCKDSPAMADVVAQQLIHPLGVLRLVGQRGNKFSPSPQSYYQWQQLPQQQQQQQQDQQEEATQSNYSFGFFDRIGGQPVPGEEVYKRTQKDMSVADEAYRATVKKIDQMRMVVEQALFAHFSEMEQVEVRRLAVLKQAIASFSLCLSEMLSGDKAIVDEMLAYQESLKPEQDIQYIVEQYCVSSFSPKPILYESQSHGVAEDQIFGVRLDELGKMTDDKVPKFVHCLLEAISERSEELSEEDKHRLWSTRLPLDRIHAICADLNIPSSQITTELLKQHEPITLVAVLRLYLLELPECLMTFEFYDTVQALYTANAEQEDSLRLSPLSNLIATLPASHFATLRQLFSHIKKAVQKDDIEAVSESLGPVILRSRTESLATLTSSLPTQLAQDLVTHYDTLFSEATLKSHAESEKRRQARPLVATNYPLSSTNTEAPPTPTAPSPTKQRRGLMSFMRSSNNSSNNSNSNSSSEVNTNSEKWMGVFQRNNSVSSASTSSSSEPRSSFTRPTPPIPITAITQGSPPSSPKESFIKKDEPMEKEKEKEKEQEKVKEPTVTKEIVFDADAHNDDELDPFFDDD